MQQRPRHTGTSKIPASGEALDSERLPVGTVKVRSTLPNRVLLILILLAAAAVLLARALPTADGTALAAGLAAAAATGWALTACLHRPWRLRAHGQHAFVITGGPRPLQALLRPYPARLLDLHQVRLVDLTPQGNLVFGLASGRVVAAPSVLFALDTRVRTALLFSLTESEVIFVNDRARDFITVAPRA